MPRSIAALLLSAFAPAPASPPPRAAPPAVLAVPAGNAERLKTAAKGTQNYRCQEKKDAAGSFEWAFTGPEADLFDDAGGKLGTHFAGPTWQLADGSKVVGAVKEKSPAAGTIPWLLLETKSAEGHGKLTGVTFIQRLDTEGGQPPAEGCDAGHAGEVRKV